MEDVEEIKSEGNRLNLTQLRLALEAEGVKFSAGALSDFLNQGEGDEKIAVQLKAQREANKVFVPSGALSLLVQFWGEMDAAGIKRDRAPQALAAFLRRQAGNLPTELPVGNHGGLSSSVSSAFGLVPVQSVVPAVTEPRTSADEQTALLTRLVQLAEAQAAARPERFLTAEEAAARIGMKTTSLIDHLKIKLGRVNRWKESTLNEWMHAQVEGENKENNVPFAPRHRNGFGKLSDAEADDIRDSDERGVDLAARFNVSPGTISEIRSGKAHKRQEKI